MTLVQDSVLVVTTDPLLGGHAVKLLEASGCQVRVVGMVSAAVQEVRCKTPALVIVDRRLLVEEVLQRHHFPTGVAVIAIQPFEQSCCEDDCIADLEAGFDLVFCSPSSRELVAHIRAILRRQRMATAQTSLLQVNTIAMDVARYEVRVEDKLVDLTPKEFQILRQLLLHPGMVLPRQELLNRVWGEDYALEEHALDVHIHSLRQKIEADPSKPSSILTIRGIGFKLQTS